MDVRLEQGAPEKRNIFLLPSFWKLLSPASTYSIIVGSQPFVASIFFHYHSGGSTCTTLKTRSYCAAAAFCVRIGIERTKCRVAGSPCTLDREDQDNSRPVCYFNPRRLKMCTLHFVPQKIVRGSHCHPRERRKPLNLRNSRRSLPLRFFLNFFHVHSSVPKRSSLFLEFLNHLELAVFLITV